jgi:hypothetical protein
MTENEVFRLEPGQEIQWFWDGRVVAHYRVVEVKGGAPGKKFNPHAPARCFSSVDGVKVEYFAGRFVLDRVDMQGVHRFDLPVESDRFYEAKGPCVAADGRRIKGWELVEVAPCPTPAK